MNTACCLTIFVGLMVWESQCCILKNECPFRDSSLVFAGRMVFDTPTGKFNGKPTDSEKHIIIIQQPRYKIHSLSFPVPFSGSGLGKIWKVSDSTQNSFCKASPMTSSECFLPPGPPRNLRVNRRTESGIQLAWEEPAVTNENILKYEIRYRATHRPYDSSFNGEGFQEKSVQAHTLQNLEYFLGTLDPSTTYEVQVWACTFVKKGEPAYVTANTKVTRDLKPVNVDDIPPPKRSNGESVIIDLPPLLQKYATGYIIRVVIRTWLGHVEEDYRTAFINKTTERTKFSVGDGKKYGTYTNYQLQEDKEYMIYIGVVTQIEKEEYVEWGEPIFIEAFVKKPFPARLMVIVFLLLIICIIAAVAVILAKRWARDRDGRKKRFKRGNRRNMALPEIPQDVERYKTFTASTKSRESELNVPILDPYGVDYGQDVDEAGKCHFGTATGVSGISKGIDVARIQNRRLPAKPPPVSYDTQVPLGTYVKPPANRFLDSFIGGAVTETEGTTSQMYRFENEKTKGENCNRLSKGIGYSENLKDFEKHKLGGEKSKDSKKRKGTSKSGRFSWKKDKSILDFGDEYDDTEIETVSRSKRNGMAMSSIARFSWKKETACPDFGDTYDDTDVDKVTGGKKDNFPPPHENECRYSITRFSSKKETSLPDYGDTYDDTDVDTVTAGKKNNALPPGENISGHSVSPFSSKKETTIPDYGDTYDDTDVDTVNAGNKGNALPPRKIVNGHSVSHFSSEKEATLPDYGDTYDDTDVDTVTAGKKDNALPPRKIVNGHSVSPFSWKKEATIPDYGDTYDDTDVDTVTSDNKDNALPPRKNESRFSIPRFGEDRSSVIYEDAPESRAESRGGLLTDIYEETEEMLGDDIYEDTVDAAVDRKKILSRTKEPSREIGQAQDQVGRGEKKNERKKKWFHWKRKDVSATANVGKEKVKFKPTAEVSPIEKNGVNYSDHLSPVKIDEKSEGLLDGRIGKQVDDDDDDYNDIYEDTMEMEKSDETRRPSRPPRNPPEANRDIIVQKWKGLLGTQNSQQNVAIQQREDRKLGTIKDYGDEYDETATESESDPRGTTTTSLIKDYGDEYDETAVARESDVKVTMTTASTPAPIPLPPRPVQVVIPSRGLVQREPKEVSHGKIADINDNELYEDTGGVEMYEVTSPVNNNEELYEVI